VPSKPSPLSGEEARTSAMAKEIRSRAIENSGSFESLR
jgi:hypothetical protein